MPPHEQQRIRALLEMEEEGEFHAQFHGKMIAYLRQQYNAQEDPRTVSELFANSFFSAESLTPGLGALVGVVNESIHKFYSNKKNQLQYLVKKQSITTHQCLCSRQANLPIANPSQRIQCLLCNGYFHLSCINLSKAKAQYTCPECTLYSLDPLHKIIETIVPPLRFKPSKDHHCKTIKFATSNPIKNQSVEIRCLRLDEAGGDEQITWPDLGEVQLNGRRLLDFRPLHKNSSLKKRKDEKFTTKDYLENNTLILKEAKATKD